MDLPLFAQIAIISAIAILVGLGTIPLFAFFWGCLRRDRILREVEERRRLRIESFLRGANNPDNRSSWQRKISSFSPEEAEDVLGRLMYTFTWVRRS